MCGRAYNANIANVNHRFGTMHVIATNLSIWILIIIEESMSSDLPAFEHGLAASTSETSTLNPTITTPLAESNKSEMMEILNESGIVGPAQMDTNTANSYVSEGTGYYTSCISH